MKFRWLALSPGRQTALVSTVVATLVACGPAGRAPSLAPVSDQVVGVGQDLVIVLSATDADGDTLFYSYEADVPDLEGRVSLDRLPSGGAELRWTPQADDVGTWYFDLSATDGDHTDTVTVRVEVKAVIGKVGAPIFRHPLGTGTTLDLSTDEDGCVIVDIVVEDADDAAVDILQEEPLIEGATLEPTGPLTATWQFCPTAAQTEAADRYTLTLSASDGEHEKTLKYFLIVLLAEEKPDCGGEGPAITHTPADEKTSAGLTIAAEVSDDIGLSGPPILYYATTPPPTPPVLGDMTQSEMLLIDGDMTAGLWAADVPNPVAGMPEGTAAEVYYVIVAADNDDPGGKCDHVSVAPDMGSYTMTVTSPGDGTTDTCEDDGAEPDDDPDNARVPDFFPEPFVAVDNTICPGNDDWYRVELLGGETLAVDLTFLQQAPDEDLDLHLLTEDGLDLTPCCTNPGQSGDSDEHAEYAVDPEACSTFCTFFVVVHGFDGASNSYDIRMELVD